MKATGIVRQVDELGRVVLPIELRRTLGIGVKDGMEICVDGEHIVLRKHEPQCYFCGGHFELQTFHGKNVCGNCREDIGALAATTKVMAE